MSTRATIKIEGVDYAKVYKHWDGYPDATLPFLEAFNKDFVAKRGNDPQYAFAQLLRASTRLAKEYDLDDNAYTGWGVVPADSDMWADYEYTLQSDGTVKVEAL